MCALALAAVPAASAHASLVSTNPTAGAVLETAPSRVVLRFDEGVSAVAGSLRVYDGDARRVDDGRVLRPDERSIAIGLPASLPHDTYTVAWRAISADSHPIRGAFVFSVGTPVGDGTGVVRQVLDDEGSALLEPLLQVARGLALWGILLVAGGAALLAAVEGRVAARTRRGWQLVAGLAVLIAVASLAQIGLTGAHAAALGVGDAFRPAVWDGVLDTTFGVVWLVRAGLALAVAACAALAWGGRSPARPAAAAALLGVGLVVTPALSGHARVQGAFAVVADAVHVAAAAAWVGGLATVALLLVVAGGDRWSLAARIVPRFSTLALVSVIALVATGVAGGLVELPALHDLWQSTYGQLVLAKTALLVPLVGLGALNRRAVVPRLRDPETPGPERRLFTRAVALELVVMAAVVGVTAVLTGEPPPRTATATATPVSADGTVGPYAFTLTVDPATAGPNEIHLYLLDATGGLAEVDEIELTATLPAMDVGPLALQAVSGGPGHVIVPRATLALAGTWRVQVSVRKGEFDLWTSSVLIPVRKDTK